MRIDPKVYNRRYDRRIVRNLKEEEKKLRCVIGSDWYRAEVEHPKERERLRQVIAEINSRCEIECEVCGKHAYEMWATLRLDKVYCNEHVPRGVMLIKVQGKIGGNDVPVPYTVGNGGVKYRYDDVIVWAEPSMYGVNGQMVSAGYMAYYCWVECGHQVWKLCESEVERLRRGKIEEVMGEIARKWKAGVRRCSGCGKEMKLEEVAGYPLFAGINCRECWERHCEETEEQRRTGKVCSMCGKPWNDCYC